jgi:hypothetical protein
MAKITRLLDSRAGGTIRTYWHKNEDGTTTIETVQDVAPIIERNKRAQVDLGKNTRGKDLFPVASIPMLVLHEWLTKYGVNAFDKNHEHGVRRLLNSNEYRYLKTSEIML